MINFSPFQRCLPVIFWIAWLLPGFVPDAAYAQFASAERIVSINICSDQLLLNLVDHDRFKSLTWNAADPNVSRYLTPPGDVHFNHGRVEEIIAIDPDVIIAGTFSRLSGGALLERIGYTLYYIDLPTSIAAAVEQIEAFGRAFGVESEADAMVENILERLSALEDNEATRPTAIHYIPGGFSYGSGTLFDEILVAAGYRNLATEIGGPGYPSVSLEDLVMHPLDLAILSNYHKDRPSLAQQSAEHPAYKHFLADKDTLTTTPLLWDCATPFIAEAAEMIAAIRRAQ